MKKKIRGALVFVLFVAIFLVVDHSRVYAAKPLEITKQPISVTVLNGTEAKVSLKARGDGLKYKWYFKDVDSSKYKFTTKFKANTYEVTMNSNRAGRKVYCVVTDKYGNSVKSNIVKLSKKEIAKIKVQPKSVTVAEGKKAKVTVKAVGDGLKYKWYFKDEDSSKYKFTTKFKANTYEVTMNSNRAGRKVYCVVTDKYGNSVKSNIVKLSKKQIAKIEVQPESVTVAEGETAKVTLEAVGDGLKYKWYFKDVDDSKYKFTTKFKANIYETIMNIDRDGREVYCVVTDKYGNHVESEVVTLSREKEAPLAIVDQPQSVSVKDGEKFTIKVSAVGDGLTYKWYYRNANAKTYTQSTITGNYYTTTMSQSRNGRRIYCEITDEYGNSVRTNIVTVKESCSDCSEFEMPSLYLTEYDATTIPVADLQKDDGEIDVQVRFDSKSLDLPDFDGNAKLKIQGATSALKPKKNFTVKLYNDETFDKKLKVDLGWGEENKYCLKANYVDSSQARNIVGARMFAELVASREYIDPNLLNAPNYGLIDGFPIAVYVNEEFHGLYTMNIPKDSWQFAMNGDETTKEALLMADQWTNSVALYEEIGEGDFEDYGWEVEYASTEDTDTTWVKDSFNEVIRLINSGDKEKIRAELAEHLDIEASIDNLLFVYFINAADNRSKNTLWYTYDGTIWAPSMYDMDGTFGIYYNGKVVTDDLNIDLAINEDGTLKMPFGNQLHSVLIECYAEEVAERWAFLRQEILTVENTTKHFQEFFEGIPEEAFHAEFHRWHAVPNQQENRENMYTATEKQLERLDAFFYNFKEYL